MPNEIDLSDRALGALRAIAEKATPGPWAMQTYNGGPYPGPFQILSLSSPNGILVSISVEGSRNCAHIAANSPDVVMAHVDEILRLRAEVKRLEREADWLAQAAANNGWHEVRVSPAFMREQARKAVEGNS